MQQHIKRIIRLSLGFGFIALGIIGLFLPVLQGILFILIGIAILEGKPIMHTLGKLWAKLKGKLKA